jgi:hypothetical protein
LAPYFISNCKELWASLSATGVVLDEDKVGQLLENHKQQLLSGVLCFKKSKTEKPAKGPTGESKTIKILVDLISETIVSISQKPVCSQFNNFIILQGGGHRRVSANAGAIPYVPISRRRKSN